MQFKRNHLLGTSILAGVMALSVPVWAQEAQVKDEATSVDDIVVTGSLIRRNPLNAPTPVIQVSRETLLESGQSTVIDQLATIPALSNSLVPTDTTGSVLNQLGLEFANLRSLGTGRTLTLVDGRRHVGSSAGALSVDVSSIPRLLIENVEVITGGASSIYGADAVSGVVNFLLRKDFEGVEIDANYGQINTDGQAAYRVSALLGRNFFDDRLNVYLHAEYEKQDEITSFDMPWIKRTPVALTIDADPTSQPYDGNIDNEMFFNLKRLDRPRWGQTTLFNSQMPSPTGNPLIPYPTRPGGFYQCDGGDLTNSIRSPNCYAVNPGSTFWYENGGARLANFGQRLGNVGLNRGYNIGGDGVSPADFALLGQWPGNESQRYQIGTNFQITPNIRAFAEAKYVKEEASFIGQPTFFDINLINTTYAANRAGVLRANSEFDLRWDDNAFLPQVVKDAIAANRVMQYSAPTATTPGAAIGDIAAPWARHSMFGPERFQENVREVTRFVGGLEGSMDKLAIFNDFQWDASYTYGELENVNLEAAIDAQRFAWAADAVRDASGNIVCRISMLAAQGAPNGALADYWRGGDIRDSEYGRDSISQCKPLNVFGTGNQDPAALEYTYADLRVVETNKQHQGLIRASGQLWDFWGAGRIGVAAGYEYRKEYTEGVGRDRDSAGRFLFLNGGPDFLGAEYKSNEVFAELAIPLLRDSFLGEYAELTGSYRYSDYTTVGNIDTWGVNLVYRPIRDITFRSSFNTSVRVPNLAENFSPASETFWNSPADPCDTRNINAPSLAPDRKANRIKNCEILAQRAGFAANHFNWTDPSATNAYIFSPSSGISGVRSGNPFLEPEESESFTFSVVLRPRFFENLSIILDYYSIEVTNVIASVTAATAAANCVNGPTLNESACATIFRKNPNIPFGIGAPTGDPIGGFIQGSINYAALKTEGLDFTVNYALDTAEWLGRDWGRFDYSLAGLWLIKQEQYTNIDNPNDVTVLTSEISGTSIYPRVRFTSALTYRPTDRFSINWTADWQSRIHLIRPNVFVNNADSRPSSAINTGSFVRHDFTARLKVTDDVSVRAGVVNAFNAEPNPWLGMTVYNQHDAFGRRFFAGVNYRF